MVQVKDMLCTGAAHIEQASFFFRLLFAFIGSFRHARFAYKREHAFVATRNVDRIEFKALRHVNRHERHTGLRIFDLLVRIRQKGNFLQEFVKALIRIFFFEFAESVHHFIEVTSAFVRSRFVFLLQEFLVEGVANHMFRKNRKRFVTVQQGEPTVDHILKVLKAFRCATALRNFGRQGFPKRTGVRRRRHS